MHDNREKFASRIIDPLGASVADWFQLRRTIDRTLILLLSAASLLAMQAALALVALVIFSGSAQAQSTTAGSSVNAPEPIRVVGPWRTKQLLEDLVAEAERQARGASRSADKTRGVTGVAGAKLEFMRADAPAQGVAALVRGNRDLLLSQGRIGPRDMGYSARQWQALAPAEHVMAARVVAVTVHSRNPLESLTLPQVQSIFAGQSADWKAFGGEAKPIRCYGLAPAAPLSSLFHEKVLTATRCRGLVRKRNSEDIVAAVMSDPQSIAFIDAAAAASNGGDIKMLAIGEAGAAVLPNAQSVKDGSYPLSEVLMLYVSPKASPSAALLARFITSGGGNAVFRKHGYVPVVNIAETDAVAAYEKLYGAEIRRVKATADPADDIFLARHLLKAAASTDIDARLTAVMCQAVYDLGSHAATANAGTAAGGSGSAADGHAVALAALRMLWQQLPEQRFKWAMQRADLWRRAYEKEATAAHGVPLIEALMMAAELGTSSDNFASAADLWRLAARVAGEINSDRVLQLNQRLPAFDARCKAIDEAAAMAERLAGATADDELRKKLLWLYVTELDRPADALRLVHTKDGEELKTYLPLAIESVERLDKETTLRVAEWYGTLINRAGEGGKELMRKRAQRYYLHFFANHEARDDALGLRACLGMQKVGGTVPPTKPPRPQANQVRLWPGVNDDPAVAGGTTGGGTASGAASSIATGGTTGASSVFPWTLQYGTFKECSNLLLAEISVADPMARSLLRRTIGSCAQLTDLSPLADMTRLQNLEITDAAKVTDLRPLSKLVNLTSLSLSGNGATDISPLATLKKLTRLNLSGNDNLRDLAPLSSLTELKRLSVYNCPQLQIETIDKLQLALPNCEIIIEPPTR